MYRKFLSAQVIGWALALVIVLSKWYHTYGNTGLDRLLQLLSVVIAFITVLVGALLFRRRLELVKNGVLPVREKLDNYYQVAMIQWILLTAASAFCILSYLLVGNWSFPALGMALLAILGGLSPFRQKVMLQLRLSEADVTGI